MRALRQLLQNLRRHHITGGIIRASHHGHSSIGLPLRHKRFGVHIEMVAGLQYHRLRFATHQAHELSVTGVTRIGQQHTVPRIEQCRQRQL